MAVQVATPTSVGFNSRIKYRYDAFLSFRGEDTRHSFTIFLYDALRRKGINAFIDDKKLGKGEEISPTLLKAIEKSRISIIVFSKNYANSTWCLEELAYITRCKKEKKQVVMPIFYKVDPLDVQYQRNSFQEAMAALEVRFEDDLEKVQKWRSALFEAASLSSAWLFRDGNEVKFIERIVDDAYAKLPPKRFHITEHMVGLEPRVEEVMSLLNNSDDRMLGIHGTGGVGKTTLAKAIYNSIFDQFEGACFLFDVKKVSKEYKGIVRLQRKLLSEILEEKRMNFGNVDEGISKIIHRLSHKRVFLVLDDVDEVEQLEQLAGGCGWFGCGSKIIITTRNKQLLIACDVRKIYEMKKLNQLYSLELFCWHAFRKSQPPKGYKNMSIHVIRHVRGLPLALKLIGSNLAAHKGIDKWRSILNQYAEIPEKTIYHVLKISYDCLQDGAKSVFLDIACFFKEEKFELVEAILKACDCGARFYIEVLVEKSLITIDDDGYLYMHDLIQQMGREIVRQEAPLDPSKRSRLWYYKDVLKVLHKNLGGNNIEGIILDPPQYEKVKCSNLVFEKMNNLRIIIVRNAQFLTCPEYLPNSLILLDWQGYPSVNLPPKFSPPKLVCLKIYGSPFNLQKQFELECLTYLNFSECEFITEVPDMSQFQNLKTLSFRKCHNLIKVHDSVGYLNKLVKLDVGKCIKLTSFPHEISMPSLVELNLNNCSSLEYFPNIVGNMDPLEYVYAEGSAIRKLPSSVGNLPRLDILSLTYCENLRELPNSLLTLHNLGVLTLGGLKSHGRKSLKKLMQESPPQIVNCRKIDRLELHNCGLLDEDVHLVLQCFQNVRDLTLSENDFVSLPECIKECVNLCKLEVSKCKKLRNIPELPSRLEDIRAENCTSLTAESSGRLWSQPLHIGLEEVKFGRAGENATRALNSHCVVIWMPATTYPDWFDRCYKGDTFSFRVHGKTFPHVVIAFETGKANRSKRESFYVFMSINGSTKMPWMQSDFPIEAEGGRVLVSLGKQGHVLVCDLLAEFIDEELEGLNKCLELDWNDVKIQVTCRKQHIDIVSCGVYVDKKQTNMENVQFKAPLLSTTSLKRRAMDSPPNESPMKILRKCKTTDKGNINNTKRRTRKTTPHQNSYYSWNRKMLFPMGKHLWRVLYG